MEGAGPKHVKMSGKREKAVFTLDCPFYLAEASSAGSAGFRS